MIQSQPIVSVLVTVYNRQSYLQATLDSILASSLRDIEVIVVDDRSTDNSLGVAQAMAARDSRIKVVANERNLGDYGNRMKAAALACGRYLKYVDSDDVIYPHALQVMVDALEQYPDANLGLAHSQSDDVEPFPWRLTPQQAWQKQFLGRGCLSCGPTGAIIRRNAFEAIGGFREEWRVLSDIDLWLRLSAHAPVVLVPPGLVWWRRHEGQEFRSGTADMFYLEYGHRLGVEALKSPSCPLGAVELKHAVGRLNQHHARRLISLAIRKRQPFAALRLYRRSTLTLPELLSGFCKYIQ